MPNERKPTKPLRLQRLCGDHVFRVHNGWHEAERPSPAFHRSEARPFKPPYASLLPTEISILQLPKSLIQHALIVQFNRSGTKASFFGVQQSFIGPGSICACLEIKTTNIDRSSILLKHCQAVLRVAGREVTSD